MCVMSVFHAQSLAFRIDKKQDSDMSEYAWTVPAYAWCLRVLSDWLPLSFWEWEVIDTNSVLILTEEVLSVFTYLL